MFTQRQVIHYSFILTLILQNVNTRMNSQVLFFQRAKSDFNREYIGNYVLQISPNKTTIDLEFTQLADLNDDLFCQVSIIMIEQKPSRYRRIFGYDVNLCALLGREKPDKFNMLHLWLKNILKYGTLPRSCPIKKNTYYFRGLKAEKDSVPLFIIDGLYRIDAQFYKRNGSYREILTNTSVDIEIKRA